MKKACLMAMGLVGSGMVTACHPDPFGVKPEVRMTLPQTEPDEENGEEDAEAPAPDQAEDES